MHRPSPRAEAGGRRRRVPELDGVGGEQQDVLGLQAAQTATLLGFDLEAGRREATLLREMVAASGACRLLHSLVVLVLEAEGVVAARDEERRLEFLPAQVAA